MGKPITLNIDCTKISKEHLKKGKYLDLVLFANKNGEDEWNNTHYVVQGISKEAREAGARGPIVGNARVPAEEIQRSKPSPPPKLEPPKKDPDLDQPEDDIPF